MACEGAGMKAAMGESGCGNIFKTGVRLTGWSNVSVDNDMRQLTHSLFLIELH